MFLIDILGEREAALAWREVKEAFSDGCRRAVRSGIAEAVEQAKTRHTFKNQTGDLERSIGGEVTTDTLGGAEGVVYAAADHASYVEEGTAAHVIRPKVAWNAQGPLDEGESRKKRGSGRTGVVLAWEHPQGDWHFAREVHHPGTTPLPFMGPAQQKCERVAIREIEASVPEAQDALDR